jgi:hypothetical protein
MAAQEPFPVGYASVEYRTDAASGWAVSRDPLVLVSEDALTHMRELLPAVRLAREVGAPVVIVAPRCEPELGVTLAANARWRSFAHLLLSDADAATREAVSSATGATPVGSDWLRSGYLPKDALGRADVWIADSGHSWALTGAESLK